MVLEFRAPYAIDPNRSPEQDRLDNLNQAFENIRKSSDARSQGNRQQQMQDLQMQLLKQDQARKQAEETRLGLASRSEYGTPASSESVSPISGPMTMDQSMRSVLAPGSPASPAPAAPMGGGMVDKFRAWQQSRRAGPAAQPQGMPSPSVGYNEVLPGLFPAQTERGLGWTGMTSPGSKGIDSAAKLFEAQRKIKGNPIVDDKGNITGYAPEGAHFVNPKAPQFVGTQGDQGVIYDSSSGFSTLPLPGGQPMGPKNQPTLPASEGEKLGDFNNILQQIGYVRNNYSSDFVGMIDSRTQAARQMTGFGANPQAAAFRASLGAIRNKLLNMLSGAAISPQEYQRLMTQLPNENASEVDFTTKLDSFEQNIKDTVANRRGAFQASGYSGQGAPIAPVQGPGGAPQMKVVGGRRYVKHNGSWFEQ